MTIGEIVSIAYWDDLADFCPPSSRRPQPGLLRRS
jgi:hypothetical protein